MSNLQHLLPPLSYFTVRREGKPDASVAAHAATFEQGLAIFHVMKISEAMEFEGKTLPGQIFDTTPRAFRDWADVEEVTMTMPTRQSVN